MRVALAVLVSSLLAAAPAAPARVCPILAADSKPVFEVRWKEGRGSVQLYPLGFSKDGRLAWLDQRRGFDSDEYSWLLYISDLSNDRVLVEESFATASPTLRAMCDQHGSAILKLLEQHKIERGKSLKLEQPVKGRDPTSVEIVAGKRDADSLKTPYQVYLSGKEGRKRIGVLFRIDPDSGEPPVDAPKFRGIVRSPSEPRVAVLVTQQTLGTEGVDVTLVSLLGARLDKGWLAAGAKDQR